MKIAITGAGGKYGSLVVPHALAHGHEIVAIDRAASTLPARTSAVRPYAFDLSDYGSLVSALRGCDALIHLAAYVNPWLAPEPTVHNTNVVSSYNALAAAEANGIRRVCLASSVNAIGGFYSPVPHYDYFPIDEDHPCYAEDAYSLSKWFAEQQAQAFVRRVPEMSVIALRLHAIIGDDEVHSRVQRGVEAPERGSKDLWGYTPDSMAAQAALNAVTRDIDGMEIVYVVAEDTLSTTESAHLAARFYPDVPLRRPLLERRSFYDTAKYHKLLA
jgi:nucleoside-diphosphate-sugar epimerase